MVEEAQRRLPNETGGILVGRVEGDHTDVVVVVGPGPKAIHLPTFFRRDGEYSQQELDAAYEQSEGRYDYLGEWHSHPLPTGPSSRDRNSMRAIACDEGYDREHPLLVLCRRTHRGAWQPRAYQWTGRQLLAVPIVSGQDVAPQVGEQIADTESASGLDASES